MPIHILDKAGALDADEAQLTRLRAGCGGDMIPLDAPAMPGTPAGQEPEPLRSATRR